MDTQTRIRKIMEETGCSFDVARAADEECGGSLEKAVQIARRKGNVLYSGGKSGLYVEEPSPKKHITQFKNGILVEDRFYDFSVDDNARLKHMLEEKTFDASLLGSNSDTAEVIYTERLDEEYSLSAEPSKPSHEESFVGEGRRLGDVRREVANTDIPEMLEIRKDGDTLFKVMVGSRRATVRMLGTQSIGEFLTFMERHCGSGLVLLSNEKEVSPRSKVSEVANKLVLLKKR